MLEILLAGVSTRRYGDVISGDGRHGGREQVGGEPGRDRGE